MDIDGKTYYCDHAGGEGAQNTRRIGTSTGNDTVFEGANDGYVRME